MKKDLIKKYTIKLVLLILNRINRFLVGDTNFNYDDKKILLVSLHKSGTHLIENILKHAGLQVRLAGKGYSSRDFYLLKKNEYLRSHFPPNIEVYNLIETKKIRVIFNFRDPRDVCISRFNWQSPTNTKVTNLTREFQKKVHKYCFENDEQFIESIIKGEKYIEEEFVLGDMFRHARGLLFHPYVHKTRFEELIGPKGGGDLDTQFNAIANLLKFLDIDKNPVEIAAKAFSSKAETFHKGQIGKYKDVFTNEHIMLFNKLHGDILHEYGYI